MAPSRKPRPAPRAAPPAPPPAGDPLAALQVTVTVSRGAATLEAACIPLTDAPAVARALEAALSAAQATTPGLRDTVDTVHGGSIPYVDDGDWGDGRGRVGFVR